MPTSGYCYVVFCNRVNPVVAYRKWDRVFQTTKQQEAKGKALPGFEPGLTESRIFPNQSESVVIATTL